MPDTIKNEWQEIQDIAAAMADDPDHQALIHDRDLVYCGYVVPYDGAMYYVAEDFDARSKLPPFVRSEADALEYFERAAFWRREGIERGRREAKRELRHWLNVDESRPEA